MRKILEDRRLALLIALVLVIIGMSFLSPYFLRINNLLGLLQYSAIVGLLALGVSIVIIGGGAGIDLSVGSMLSVCSTVFGMLTVWAGISPWLAIPLVLAAGAVMGLVNGLIITYLNVLPLIATLGTLYLYGSLALVLSGGLDINGFKRHGFEKLGQSAVLGIPSQVLFVLIPAALVIAFIMRRTKYGREVYELGSSDRAGELTGVHVKSVRIRLYVISGVLSGLGAIVAASWLLNAKATAGLDYELQAITIAVLGGVVITGGIGRISGVFIALLLVATLNSGMSLAGIGNTVQVGLLGAVLIGASMLRKSSGGREFVP